MPTIVDTGLSAKPTLGVPKSPTGDNDHTDVEYLSDQDQSSHLSAVKLKLKNDIDDSDDENLTDEDDITGSEFEEEENNLELIDITKYLSEEPQELLNLTEGYARGQSPLLSDSEDNTVQNIEDRHIKNVKNTLQKAQSMEETDTFQALTDEENMAASDDDFLATKENEIETTLPDHYLQEVDSFLNHEIVKSIVPVAKFIFGCRKKTRTAAKEKLRQELQKKGIEPNTEKESKENDKKNMKKIKKRQTSSNKLTVSPSNCEAGVTDTELLVPDDESSIEESSEEDSCENFHLSMKELTDVEDMQASDLEDDDLTVKPIAKETESSVPEPYSEKVKISEVPHNTSKDYPDIPTDEEGFQLEEREDDAPLILPTSKYVFSDDGDDSGTDSGDEEDKLTDLDDINVDEKEDEDIINDIIKKMPTIDSNILVEMEYNCDMTSDTKNQEQKVSQEKIPLLFDTDDALTDVEEWNEKGDVKKIPRKSRRTDSSSDSGDIDEYEEETPKRKKKPSGVKYLRRLPIVSQASEVKYIETDLGPLSIVITPDQSGTPKRAVKYSPNPEESDCAFTDIEDLDSDYFPVKSEKPNVKYEDSIDIEEPATDVEDFDVPILISDSVPKEEADICFLPNPKREKIHIREDKDGVPHVEISELQDKQDVDAKVEQTLTDTENLDVSEGDLEGILGGNESDHIEGKIAFDIETTEVTSKPRNKKNRRKHKDRDEDGHTDVEDLIVSRKGRRKPKSKNDIEIEDLDSSDTENIVSVDTIQPPIVLSVDSPSGTDSEQFEASEGEDQKLAKLKAQQ